MGVFLNKLLPLPLMPLGFAMMLLAYAILTKKRWPAVVSFILLWAASMPVTSELLLRRLEATYPRIEVEACPESDAVVILGGFARQSNGSTPAHPEFSGGVERLLRGLDLLEAGRVRTVVLSGARIQWLSPALLSEGEFVREVALRRGVRDSQIVLTSAVQNTADEAASVSKLMRERGWKRVVLVTSAFHLPRAMQQFKRAGVEAVPFPCDWTKDPARPLTLLDYIPSGDGLADTHMLVREFYGRAFYALRSLW